MDFAFGRLRARLGSRAPAFVAAWSALGPLDPQVAADVLSADIPDLLKESGCIDEELVDLEIEDAMARFREEVIRLASLKRHRRGALREPALEDAVIVTKRARLDQQTREAGGAGSSTGPVAPLPGALPRPRRRSPHRG